MNTTNDGTDKKKYNKMNNLYFESIKYLSLVNQAKLVWNHFQITE